MEAEALETNIEDLKNFILENQVFQEKLKTAGMNHAQHNLIVSFIWSIADDVLRDVYTRGKYRDIILPFTVLRRLDALLEPTKEKILEKLRRKLTSLSPL